MGSNSRMTWGATALIPTRQQEADFRAGTRAFLIEASGDGLTWGNPQAVITAIRSHLQDGSLAAITSYDNRQGTVRIRVTAKTYDGLDEGGKALAAEQRVPGYSTLTWTPHETLAVPTVFDVVYATLNWEFDDAAEAKVGNRVLRRQFVASFENLPFGRDQALTTIQATSAGGSSTAPTYTLVNDASSTTGWTGSNELTAADGYVQHRGGGVRSNAGVPVSVFASMTYTPASGVSMSGTPYLAVDYFAATASPDGNPPTLTVNGSGNNGGTTYNATLLGVSDRSGYSRAFYQVAETSVTSARLNLSYVYVDNTLDPYTTRVDKIQRTATLPSIGTNRQRARSLTIGGSARARVALAITADAGKTLGDLTLLYTRTATTGLQPPLRPFRTSSSSVTVDTTLISGAYNSLSTPMVFLVPASRLREAAHDLILRMRSTAAGDAPIAWSAALVSNTNADLPETTETISGVTTVTFPANTWVTAEVGLLQLPTVPVAPDSTHMIRLTLSTTSSTIQVDEGWLFDLDNGVLSWVDTTGLTRLEVRTADLSNPEPSYWGGAADGGGAAGLVRADRRVKSFGSHIFEPGPADITTITSGTEGSACSASFYRAWLHSAAA